MNLFIFNEADGGHNQGGSETPHIRPANCEVWSMASPRSHALCTWRGALLDQSQLTEIRPTRAVELLVKLNASTIFLHWTKYPTHYTPYTPYTPYPARRTSIKDHKGCFFYVKTCKGTEPRMSDFSTLDTWATFINLPVIFKAKSLIKNHTAYSLSSPCCKGLIQQPFGNPRTLEFITGTSSRSWEARETTKARWKLKKDNLLNNTTCGTMGCFPKFPKSWGYEASILGICPLVVDGPRVIHDQLA